MAKKTNAPAPRKVGGVTVSPRTVAFVVVAILAVWFILMNTSSVRIHLWGLSTATSPLWFVLLVMLVAGILLGWALHRYRDGRK
ncbi:LapA family protein [Streptacidiphilus sp. P02-A3a]|uniref:LapA family protein n=1 Tax=Streptacidiphilus sp. P02-A3a TaxID=2704468 RepID=UPI0015FDA347|nr:LapA family protein [Streptacidiphilus sp. P02-A3a]QMU69283.1 LapA family protein [Streptacidiphilus sp. P02-A3a]